MTLHTGLSRRDFLSRSVSAAALASLPGGAGAAGCPGKAAVLAERARQRVTESLELRGLGTLGVTVLNVTS